ncbi:Glyoxylase, beta-lactamase superfamily II [Mesorhizobium albiziae]|uniref:Glyoxylase, beta-lactamase superfamily II n=1 Tax=Neomesorhizobium albiziae TaxID=335020 RepID=A0A1I3ZYX5_9HYPH|nr:MBL fold metallo-hydrolase [Mesorhizobium albiziae]GLS33939.1 MBL fold metallo-hydrolase [Mesorhizobium albiziae]SFK49140.1 Glyoxylase, beta-lactamase superfamily II [Mesorhizobium albiziae]
MHGNWFRKRRIADDLSAFDEPYVHDVFRSNIWHLRGRDADLIVDTGMGLGILSAALDLTPGKPVMAVATHAHADHVGSLHEFADRLGPRIEAPAFATMDDKATYADMFRVLTEPVSRPPTENWNKKAYTLHPAPLTRMLDDGDVVDIGDRILRVLHLPGHSPGSMGLLDEKDGLFFSGDAIYQGELYDELPDSDRETYRATMALISRLQVRIVHGGHGESFDATRMRQIAETYIRQSRP